MCGIAGIVLREAQTIDPGFASVQAHRGPDQQGLILSDGETISFHSQIELQPRQARLALIHHRLSIIDLSDLSRQPMSTGSVHARSTSPGWRANGGHCGPAGSDSTATSGAA